MEINNKMVLKKCLFCTIFHHFFMFSVLGYLSLLVNRHLQPPRHGGRQLLEVVPGHVAHPHLFDPLHHIEDGGVSSFSFPLHVRSAVLNGVDKWSCGAN
jgi:hypothetical protein